MVTSALCLGVVVLFVAVLVFDDTCMNLYTRFLIYLLKDNGAGHSLGFSGWTNLTKGCLNHIYIISFALRARLRNQLECSRLGDHINGPMVSSTNKKHPNSHISKRVCGVRMSFLNCDDADADDSTLV